MPVRALRSVRDRHDVERITGTPLSRCLSRRSTHALFLDSAAAFGERIALRFLLEPRPDGAERTWTFRQLLADIHRTANALHGLGVGPTDAVALLLPACPEYHLGLWGGAAAGIAQPLNPLLRVEHLEALLRASGARVLVAYGEDLDAPYHERARALLQRLPDLRVMWVRPWEPAARGEARRGVACGPREVEFQRLLDAAEDDRLPGGRRIQGEDIAAYFHTGGTTGAPKIARHTHFNQVFAAWAAIQMQGLGPGDVALNGFPLFHVAGVIPGSLAALSAGVQVIIPTLTLMRNPQVVRNYWRLVAHHRVTSISAVPTVLAALAEVPLDGADLSSVRYCRVGAAPLPRELAARFERCTGLRPHENLGMTETMGVTSISPRGLDAPVGCVGFPVPHTTVRIAPLTAGGAPGPAPVATGTTGMVLVKGPNVFPGYLDPTADEGMFTADGWLVTGDLGLLDEDGRLHLSGRARDVIIRSGHNVDPRTIEAALDTHPGVQTSAAVGAPDAYAGELPVAFVVPTPGWRFDEGTLLEHAARHVAEPPARPRRVFPLEALPLTNVGKIFKPELRRRAAAAVATALAGDDAVVAELDDSGRVSLRLRPDHGLSAEVLEALGRLPLPVHPP